MDTLLPEDFGFSTNAVRSKDGQPTRLKYATVEPEIPTINEVILPPTASGNAVLAFRAELGNDSQSLSTVAEVRFVFNDQDRLLMAVNNPDFTDAALWELIGKLPEDVADTLLEEPEFQGQTKAYKLATGDNPDPDMNLDLTRYQLGQLVFAIMGACPVTD